MVAAVLAMSLTAPAYAQAVLGGDKSDRWAKEDAERKRVTDELEKSAWAASSRTQTQQQAIDPWANMRGTEPAAKPERKSR
jgi:hypothetical protein